MKITVSIDPSGEEGLIMISVKNVLYLEFEKSVNRVLVHTQYHYYFLPGPTKFWVTGLNNCGFFLRFVDRTNAVNLQNILRIDKASRIITFKGTEKICIISRRMFNQINDEFLDIK
ncbi:LytTR family transcriptional regulator DNA-binding domain-containing protein [Paenibacillus alvei]|uniref:LytTR family transcriptional regulator DNA-binding domain-containing protein n=1 Tax=Paenibacillus alvei TaxID=44250 RepID=UPI000288FACE|nr:LytTR family transcriptional regulator DNA-binding domain-containing protein [Paenibacillus alvei]EJW14128.1 hypothetical protein PAV_20c00060 [Paenibacillus alvei DSM 29]MCY9544866.1 LytTR family transcriptional regulator DNA-binding domain-containing protein [Paenibacillus alvei]MCY9708722.1 LytTR family transcriptional regulator DNA-binding domain-containing protein [Paenibacillus alvei]MEC0084553.1 LytTR family transcriptional regulator DNA-binding domain-containing protein [Paenibacillu